MKSNRTIKAYKVVLSRDMMQVYRNSLLKIGGSKIYYSDIENVDLVLPNGSNKTLLSIILKDRSSVQLSMPSEEAGRKLKDELEEIVSPRVVKSEKPLVFKEISSTCFSLIDTKGSNIKKMLDLIIAQAICHVASDIHMEYEGDVLQIQFRIDGVLFPIVKFDYETAEKVINCTKVTANLKIYAKDSIQEGRIVFKTLENTNDLRVSVIPSSPHEKIAIRMFDALKGSSDLDELGFKDASIKQITRITETPQGFFIVTGPSGSGKTTTLYALLRHIKKHRGNLANIITVEDPIEYSLPNITQVQINPKQGVTFAKALMSALRQDPEVIMIGEIRDSETANAAVQAALTGHLVLTTLHCGSAAEAIARLLDLGVKPYLLKSTLSGVLCQRLVRTVCKECGRKVSINREDLNLFEGKLDGKSLPKDCIQGIGCGKCHDTGYRKRTVISEFLECGDNIRNMLNGDADTASIENAAARRGMVPLLDAGLLAIGDYSTDIHEIRRVLG